jgi:uncharacterized protein (UPF0332 family)
MSLSNNERNILIDYRLKQAKDTIKVIDLLIKNNELTTAVNRIYYGIFYSLLALGLKYKFETSKHQQLIGWFNKDFIHSGRIDPKYGKILRNAYEYRSRGDYDVFVDFNVDTVKKMFSEMKEFIKIIEEETIEPL